MRSRFGTTIKKIPVSIAPCCALWNSQLCGQGPVEQYLAGLESHIRLALREILEQAAWHCVDFIAWTQHMQCILRLEPRVGPLCIMRYMLWTIAQSTPPRIPCNGSISYHLNNQFINIYLSKDSDLSTLLTSHLRWHCPL